ncbi:MAG: endonuclease/exonuclease/phosphatase family protein [Planctomycetota bacterium]|nr:endonuclease/exonuclease/phosphatase family protein [Planctomycetota bacterium]
MDATDGTPQERSAGSRGRQGFFSLKLRPWHVLGLFVVLACLATLAGFLGRWWWRFENFGAFKVQGAVFLALAAAAFWLAKRRNSAIVAAVFALVNAAAFVPLYFGGNSPAGPAQFRVMLINVHTANTDYEAVRTAVRRERPDALVALEVNQRWVAELDHLRDEWPFRKQMPRPDNFGIVLYSRTQPVAAHILHLGEAEVPTVLARYDVAGKRLTLIGTHPVPPVNLEYVAWRNEQMALLAELIRATPGAVVLVGDLNMTADSPVFRDFCSASGLRDSRQGFGVQATWPAHLPPLLIPIDHCLVSREVLVRSRRVGKYVGSDHFPVIADFSVKE